MSLFNEEGNEVEGALTPEEVAARLDEVRKETATQTREEVEGETNTLKDQLAEKETALTTAKADLEKEKSKDKNLAGQRKIIEDKEKEIADLKTAVNDLKTQTETRISAIETEGKAKTITAMINELTGGNSEMNDKVRFYYESFKPVEETGKKPEDVQKEITERIKNAYVLATGGKPTIPISGSVLSSAGGQVPNINPSGEKLSPELQDLAHKMGADDATLKRHKLI